MQVRLSRQFSLLTVGTQHFHQFINILAERGVDMSHAKISKAEIALWGSVPPYTRRARGLISSNFSIEHIKKAQKSQQRMIASGKQGIQDTLHKVGDVAHVSSWKREVLEGRRKPPPEEKSTHE
ncbi:hypothetical protein B0H17DRAFT_620791 [Mycena rosella]|uniref:Uncharacterized protein n=1 Tax=Mycena rosella TaxID=1033263 RepID=A0AAD7GVX9_MYCRO|nr:hypothetical protein B0H17DRAFT_620791 [Mycena rosella]